MKIFYHPAAISDLQASVRYLSDVLKNKSAAHVLRTAVLHGVSLLAENPSMGTPLSSRFDGLETDIRYLVIKKQMVFYEVTANQIEILRILDGRTDYLTTLF